MAEEVTLCSTVDDGSHIVTPGTSLQCQERERSRESGQRSKNPSKRECHIVLSVVLGVRVSVNQVTGVGLLQRKSLDVFAVPTESNRTESNVRVEIRLVILLVSLNTRLTGPT